jgi:hypothetical protein
MNLNVNRDLMVVLREDHLDADWLNTETAWLNQILNRVEATANLAYSCEVLNLSRYKIEKKYDKVLKALKAKDLKPFVFIFNKN